MTLSKRVLLITAMMIIALVSAACGGGGGGGGSGSATDAAKTFFEALLKADGNALRGSLCAAQQAAITDEVVSSLSSSIGGTGAEIDPSGVTYTLNGSEVTLGGVLKVSMSGQSVDVPMEQFPLGNLPVVEEGGGWKVCINPLTMG
ncbi:MAG: hypothetical protein KJ043_16635, partial [Anaerolineae bacterium]|nr:hypothetical protein [Anaerolineae bacterium]